MYVSFVSLRKDSWYADLVGSKLNAAVKFEFEMKQKDTMHSIIYLLLESTPMHVFTYKDTQINKFFETWEFSRRPQN